MMKILPFLFLLILAAGCSKKPIQPADLIIQGGYIYTVNSDQPNIEAVAVRDGLITYVGGKKEAILFIGPNTKIIDLNNKTMIPGLIEGHAHLINLGERKSKLNFLGGTSYNSVIKKIQKKAFQLDSGEWIEGGGWHQSKWVSDKKNWVKGFPTHHKLSEVSPNHPVYLVHASGHAALINKAAMDLAGIDKNSIAPEGGEIIKDSTGEPTGMLVENAEELIIAIIPPPSNKRRMDFVQTAFQESIKNGITSFQDAGSTLSDLKLFDQIFIEKGFPIRLWVLIRYSKDLKVEEIFPSGKVILKENFLSVGGIKIWADGALGSRGAWLLKDYLDRPGHRGHETVPMQDVYSMAQKALKHNFQLAVHAIGDRANKEVLDNMQKALSELGGELPDHRFRIEHAQHIHGNDIPRFAKLGVLASMQGIHMASDMPWAIKRLGNQRIEEGAYVWRKLLNSGARIISGTDAPVEPISPLQCFYVLVSRKTLNGKSEGWFHPEQKMTREEALKSYTLDAAYGAFEDAIKGSIEIGKLADFTILSKDIMVIPEEEILSTEVVSTIVGGEIKYSIPEFFSR